VAKGRKHPAPRGYNPGGFRFPTRGAFYESPSRFAVPSLERPIPVNLGLGAAVVEAFAPALAALALAALVARRRRG
jgi:hypothetical protein